MTHDFDKDYWASHWASATGGDSLAAHPALDAEVAGLRPGSAVEAGSGEGAEAAWLAARGWRVTAVDIAASALRRAAARAEPSVAVSWIEADLTTWSPAEQVDLVTTFYAHASVPQHDLYERLAQWVAPGGTLLLVGHADDAHPIHDHPSHDHPSHDHPSHAHASHGQASHAHEHPAHAATAPERIRALLDPAAWIVHTAEVRERLVAPRGGAAITLRDVVVRAERR